MKASWMLFLWDILYECEGGGWFCADNLDIDYHGCDLKDTELVKGKNGMTVRRKEK